jgi:hypothetical protein
LFCKYVIFYLLIYLFETYLFNSEKFTVTPPLIESPPFDLVQVQATLGSILLLLISANGLQLATSRILRLLLKLLQRLLRNFAMILRMGSQRFWNIPKKHLLRRL